MVRWQINSFSVTALPCTTLDSTLHYNTIYTVLNTTALFSKLHLSVLFWIVHCTTRHFSNDNFKDLFPKAEKKGFYYHRFLSYIIIQDLVFIEENYNCYEQL